MYKKSHRETNITTVFYSNIKIYPTFTSNIRSSIWALYKLAAIILANRHTSLVTSGVTLAFPVVDIRLELYFNPFCKLLFA